jgi:ankyrin repeat protein
MAVPVLRCLVALVLALTCQGAEALASSALTADSLSALVRSGTAAEVTEALRQGADPNALNRNHRTALMEAVMWGVDDAVVSALLVQPVDVNARGSCGTTALHWVGWSAKATARPIPLLIAAGADPDAAAQNGSTARSVAQERGNQEVLKALDGGRKPQVEAAPGF